MTHQNATRERLTRQVQDLGARVEAQQMRHATTRHALDEVTAQQPGLEAALMEAEAAGRQATDSTLPEKEAALREAQQGVGEAQRAVSQLDQSRQVDENSLGHTKRQLEQLDARQRRLAQEQAQLPRPDAAGLAQKQVELEELAQTLATAQAGLRDAETALPELDAARTQHQRDLEAARKALHQTEAELTALKKLQESLKADEKLGAWLQQRGLDAAPRLWEKLRVAAGWEAAVEAVLRERLQAVAAAALTDWLTGVYWADDAGAAKSRCASLQAGETVVTPQGHLFTRHSVSFHGPHTAVEGILARGRELERLTADAVNLRAEVTALEAAYAEAQQGYQERQR